MNKKLNPALSASELHWRGCILKPEELKATDHAKKFGYDIADTGRVKAQI